MAWNISFRPGLTPPAVASPLVGALALTGAAPIITAGGNSASLTWTPPTQDENGGALTPNNHRVYASQESQDPEAPGFVTANTNSSSGSYNFSNAAFTGGTTWFFWVRAEDTTNGTLSPYLSLGSRTF